MTAAWYGHLRFKNAPLWKAILVSWAIAFFEYCLQVPANRWGYGEFHRRAAQGRAGGTLIVFAGFAWLWLGPLRARLCASGSSGKLVDTTNAPPPVVLLKSGWWLLGADRCFTLMLLGHFA